MNAEKKKRQSLHSFQYDTSSYTTSTIKPILQEQVWPSTQLPPPKKDTSFRNPNIINDSGRTKFNDYIDSKRRRKLKSKRNRTKRRRNRILKHLFNFKDRVRLDNISGRKRKRLSPAAKKYLKEKRWKAVLKDKIRRGIPYPHLPTSKPLPNHMKNSLLVLMPEGPRSPFFESIGKLWNFIGASDKQYKIN